jgi:hypothetical protein
LDDYNKSAGKLKEMLKEIMSVLHLFILFPKNKKITREITSIDTNTALKQALSSCQDRSGIFLNAANTRFVTGLMINIYRNSNMLGYNILYVNKNSLHITIFIRKDFDRIDRMNKIFIIGL